LVAAWRPRPADCQAPAPKDGRSDGLEPADARALHIHPPKEKIAYPAEMPRAKKVIAPDQSGAVDQSSVVVALPVEALLPASLVKFREFCAALRVDTKDGGVISLSEENWLGTQRYFIDEIERGLNDGVHSFVVLKGRQLGITTIALALDLFFLFKYSGLSGSLVTHDEESRDMFKSTLSMYIDGLPQKFKVPLESHNRTQLVAKNRSRVAYQVAGTRKNSKLGKGKGLTFLHATEVSSWGDEEGLASLIASLSEINPHRLYVYESTAQGFNMFTDMWERAKDSTSSRAIFIGWWMKETYAKAVGSQEFRVYWGGTVEDGKMTLEERKWVDEVMDLYGFKITPEQIAWWRWKKEEEVGDDDLMYQNFPPTERYAFIASGENFFSTARLSDAMKKIKRLPKGEMYRFVLRENFEDCDITETIAKHVNLTVWEGYVPPANGAPGGKYVIGADPAYGSSDWADRFCASVWRCYGDGMVQVAEFNTPDCNTYQFAWVILYLAGAYRDCMLNLEINGPGAAVWQEIQNMRRMAGAQPKSPVSKKIMYVVQNLQNYLYKRLDTFGRPAAYHWQTTQQTKERMLNFYKDCFERGVSEVNSTGLIEEMQRVVRDDGVLGAPDRKKDDRVMAAGLAHVAWADFVRMKCIQQGLLKPKEGGVDESHGMASRVIQPSVSPSMKGYLARIGVKV
jgi:hypothetical protein